MERMSTFRGLKAYFLYAKIGVAIGISFTVMEITGINFFIYKKV
jgi:hypothetical protein